MTSTVKTSSLKHKFNFLTAVVNKSLSYCFPLKRKESELQRSGKTRENTVQNRTSLIANNTSRSQKHTSNVSTCFQSVSLPYIVLSLCANWVKQSRSAAVRVLCVVCFEPWSAVKVYRPDRPSVSHLASVTCSWPRCWNPGRRPWSGWRETSRRPRRLRHGSETPSPPAPIWTANSKHNRIRGRSEVIVLFDEPSSSKRILFVECFLLDWIHEYNFDTSFLFPLFLYMPTNMSIKLVSLFSAGLISALK